MTKVKKSIWSKIGIALLSFALVVSSVFVVVGNVAKADNPAPTRAEENRFKNALNNDYIEVSVNQDEKLVIDNRNYDTSCLVDGFYLEEEQVQTAEEFIATFLDNKALYEKIKAYYNFGEEGEQPNIDVNLYTALTAYREVWNDVFAAPEAVKARINDELAPLLEQDGGVKYTDMGTFLSVKNALEAIKPNQQAYVMYKGKEAAEENFTEEYQTYLAVKNALEAIEARLDALVEKIEGDELNAGDLDTMLEEGVKLSDETAFLAIEAEYLALPDVEGSVYTEKKYVDEKVSHGDYAECPTDVVNIELVRAALNAIKARLDNIYDMIVSTDRQVQDKNVVTTVEHVRPLGHMVTYGVHVSDSEDFGIIDGYYQAVVDATEKAYLDGKLAEVEQMLDDTSAYTAPETNVYNIEYVREALRQKEAQLNALVEAIVNTTSDKVTIAVMDGNDEVEVDVTPLGYILANFDYSYKADFDYVDGAYRVLGGDALEYVNGALADYNQLDDETYPTEDMVEEGDDFYPTSVVNIELLRELFNAKEEYLNDLVAAIENASDEEQVVVEYEDGEEEIERPLHFMTIDGVGYADKADFDFIDAAYAALTEAEKTYVDERVTAVTDEVYTNKVTDVKYIEDVREALTQRENELDALVEKIEGEVLGENELDTMLENGVEYADKAAFDAIDEEYANLTEEEKAYVDSKVTVDEEEYANYPTQVKNIEEVRKALEAIEARLDELVKRIVSNDRYEVGEGNDVELVTPLGYMLGTGVGLEYEEEFNAVDEEYANLTEAEQAYVDAELQRYQQMLEDTSNYTAPVTNVRNIEEVREALNKIKTALNWLVKAINDTEEFEMPVADVAMFLPDELTAELEETIVVKPLGKMLADGVKLEDLPMFTFVDSAYASLVEEELDAELAYVNARVTAVTDEVYTNQVTEVKNIEEVREALLQIKARLDLLVRRLSEAEDFVVGETTYKPVYYFVVATFAIMDDVTTDEQEVALMNEYLEYEDTFNALDAEYKALEGAEKTYVDAKLDELEIIFDPTTDFNKAIFGEETDTYVASLEFFRVYDNLLRLALDELAENIESDVQLERTETEELENVEQEVPVTVDPLHYMTLRGVVYEDKEFFDEVDKMYGMLFGASKDYVDAKVTPVTDEVYTNQVTNVKYIEDVREALLQRKAELDLLVRRIVGTEEFEVDETTYTPLGYVLRQTDVLAYEDTFNAVDEEYRNLSEAEQEYIDGQLVDFEQIDEETYAECPTYVVNIEMLRARLVGTKDELDEFIREIEEAEQYVIEDDEDEYEIDPLHYMTLRGVDYNTDKAFFDKIDDIYRNKLTDAERAYVDSKVTPVEEGAEYTNQLTDVKYIEDVREALAQRENELDALVEKIEGVVLGENELDTMLDKGVKISDKAAFDAIDGEYAELGEAEKAYVDSKVSPVEDDAEYTNQVTDVKNIEEVREALTQLINELHDRINEVIDGDNTDMDNIDDIIDNHDNNMDDDQLDDLADAFEGERDNYWQEFLDAVKKLRFAMFFKQAVQEVHDQVTKKDYFTVEGYAVEKMLNSMYCSFAFTEFGNGKTLQDLVKDPCETQLAEIDALYEELDEEGNLVHTRYDYASLEEEVNNVAEDLADLLDPENENSLAAKVANLADRLAAAEGQLDPETEGSLAAELAALQQEVAELLDPNKEGSLAHKLAALEGQLDPETEGTLAAKVAELLAELNPETEGSLADKVAKLQTALVALQDELNPEKEGSVAARLAALEGKDTFLEQELATLRTNLQKEMKQLKDDNQKEVDALKAENEQLKKDLDEKTDKLNKTMLIGLIALGVVAVALVACVAVLFGKTKALANGGSSKKDEE